MGLILTRSPFFVSSEGYGDNVQLGLTINYLVDGVIANTDYQLNFGEQKEIDVSPLIADYYSKEADILYVEIEVGGTLNTIVAEYLATDGYGYYEDGYNLDLVTTLESNSFYAGSNDKVQFYKDGIATIPLLASVNDARTTIKYLKNGVASEVNTLSWYINRISTESGVYEESTCLLDFLDEINYNSDSLPILNYATAFPTIQSRLDDRITYVSIDLSGFDVDEIELNHLGNIKKLKVEAIQECKYTPYKLRFRNRYGVLEDLWFFKRTNESLQTERKDFNRVTFDSYKAGDLSRHSMKQYNVNGKESIELNTGWVCESFYENIKQLMLSEEVYLVKEPPLSVQANNLVVNGTFQNDIGWDLRPTDNVSGGKLNMVGQGSRIPTNLYPITGKKYQVSFDLTDYTSGEIGLFDGNGGVRFTPYLNQVGSYSYTYIQTDNILNQLSFFALTSFEGSIDNVVLREVVDSTLLPLNITDSDFRYKTHVNDKVINYSINADFAYQKINNIV
jgi:hypothetical protein